MSEETAHILSAAYKVQLLHLHLHLSLIKVKQFMRISWNAKFLSVFGMMILWNRDFLHEKKQWFVFFWTIETLARYFFTRQRVQKGFVNNRKKQKIGKNSSEKKSTINWLFPFASIKWKLESFFFPIVQNGFFFATGKNHWIFVSTLWCVTLHKRIVRKRRTAHAVSFNKICKFNVQKDLNLWLIYLPISVNGFSTDFGTILSAVWNDSLGRCLWSMSKCCWLMNNKPFSLSSTENGCVC